MKELVREKKLEYKRINNFMKYKIVIDIMLYCFYILLVWEIIYIIWKDIEF